MSRALRLVFVCLVCFSRQLLGADQGTLSGQVLDHQHRPVPGVMVIVCDAQTGIPVSRDTFERFTKDMQFQNLASMTSDEDGRFSQGNVKPGIYRLIAQSWDDATKPVAAPLEVNGRVVRLRGIVERLVVPSEEATRVTVRPCGTASLDLTTDPKSGNNDTLLVVSSQPLSADPVLAFAAWSGSFMPAMIAGNRMPLGRTTLHGLPQGRVHIAAFANDNNPGFGGTSCELKSDQTVFASIPLIASWSDGHKEPPARLEPLVELLRKKQRGEVLELVRRQHPDIAQVLDATGQRNRDPWSVWVPYLERNMVLGEGRSFLLKDVLAADGYARLIERDASRREQQKRDQLKKVNVDEANSHEQAFSDLYERLGRDYPCFKLKSIDWKAVGDRLLPCAKEVRNDQEFGVLCLELVAALEDNHAPCR